MLWAWAIFILAGLLVAKTSEHWQSALPPGSHPVASAAFVALTVLAAATAGLVRGDRTHPAEPRSVSAVGGWPQIRRWILAAASLTAALVAATAGLAAWAHGLSPHARNGHDGLYGAAFLTWAALAAGTLLAWTKAATGTADHLSLGPRTLLLHAHLTRAIAPLMAVMTVATVAWWVAVAIVMPGALTGAPAIPHASPFVPALFVATVLMMLATTLATAGARRAQTA